MRGLSIRSCEVVAPERFRLHSRAVAAWAPSGCGGFRNVLDDDFPHFNAYFCAYASMLAKNVL